MRAKNKLCFLFIIAFLLTGVVFEISVRFTSPSYADNTIYPQIVFSRILNANIRFDLSENVNRKFGAALPPNSQIPMEIEGTQFTVTTNSSGFRAREPRPKQNGEYRILSVGDDLFFGMGMDEKHLFSHQLEQSHQPSLQTLTSFSVYNYAILGYNSVQELIVAQHYSPVIQPDHLLLGFFVGNDILPNAAAFVDKEGNYAVDSAMLKQLKNRANAFFPFFFHSAAIRKFGLPLYAPRIRYRLSAEPAILEKSFQHLQAFQDYARQEGIRFSVVMIYPRDAVQGGLLAAWTQSRHIGRRLTRFCQQQGIEVLDLLEVMDGKQARERYFFQGLGFLNQEAHAMMAQSIYERFLTKRLTQK